MPKAAPPLPSALPEPVTIYVLWHPERDRVDDTARYFAGEIFGWYRMKSGYGAPVYFRSAPLEEGGETPLEIPASGKNALQLVVVLASAEMVADHAWRAWLENLAERPNVLLFPVALDPTAYNLPPALRALNFISVQPAAGRGAAFAGSPREQSRERLLKQLTEAFARVLTHGGGRVLQSGALLPEAKVRIFLSHAKADDTAEARALRDYIYGETQLSAFFDENDIAYGNSFAEVLGKALEQGETAALAVFHGDHYAGRPWCRQEIQAFRQPMRAPGGERVWKLHPMIVLQTMKGQTSGGIGVGRTIAELGSATCIRWQEHSEAIYLASLLREVFLDARHLRVALAVEARLRRTRPRLLVRGTALINWTPDLPTLLRVVELTRAQRRGERLARVIYPGHGLSGLELETLRLYFPSLELLTFTEALA